MGNRRCWRANKDTRTAFGPQSSPSRGARRQHTPHRGRLSYGTAAGLLGLAEPFSCCALTSVSLTLHAAMRSAAGRTAPQHASACVLVHARLRRPSSPTGRPQLPVVPHRSGFWPLCVRPQRHQPTSPLALGPCEFKPRYFKRRPSFFLPILIRALIISG